MKVSLFPRFNEPDKGEGGIRRVIEAQLKYLPEFGVEFVDKPEDADLTHCHAGNISDPPGVPMISSNHGLYWSDYHWEKWADIANAQIVQALSIASAHTAPSEWVANALKRGMLIDPKVIYHGVEAEEWSAAEHPQDFVLWNKARYDVISNPGHMEELAERMGSVKFVSTLATPGVKLPNVQVCGVMSAMAMKGLIRHAGLQMVTTRETFGILTLEAMACGVPIVGWDYAGQSEIVIQGETGYLAPPGDYEALAECVTKAFAERKRLSENCLQDIRERWGWRPRMQEYFDLYTSVLDKANAPVPKVSVIVPCYNMEKYIADTINSVKAQTLKDFECLVIDDCSTDYSTYTAECAAAPDKRFKFYKTPQNLGLCGTRNFGLEQARGKYICFLDGDDMLTPAALAAQARVLDCEAGIHITYGHLDVTNEDGDEVRRNNWPFKEFSWFGQMAHLNMIPATALVRREVYDRAGGFRRRHWRAEDAWFWTYVTSFGFAAERATDATTHIWRSRANNKSKGEGGDGDWVAEFPWAIAHSAQEAMDIIREEGTLKLPNGSRVPFGAQGPLPEDAFWNVFHRCHPKLSVIVETGDVFDYDKAIDTLDSLNLNEYHDWECFIDGAMPENIPGALWAKPLNGNKPKGRELRVKAGHVFTNGELGDADSRTDA